MILADNEIAVAEGSKVLLHTMKLLVVLWSRLDVETAEYEKVTAGVERTDVLLVPFTDELKDWVWLRKLLLT